MLNNLVAMLEYHATSRMFVSYLYMFSHVRPSHDVLCHGRVTSYDKDRYLESCPIDDVIAWSDQGFTKSIHHGYH